MPQNPPQTLSVKRKRNDAPVDALFYEQSKRQKNASVAADGETNASNGPQRKKLDIRYRYVRVQKESAVSSEPLASPTSQTERIFHIDRSGGNAVFVERDLGSKDIEMGGTEQKETAEAHKQDEPLRAPSPPQTSRPRKRPGASTKLPAKKLPPANNTEVSNGPSEEIIRQFEAFSEAVEKDMVSPMKKNPKSPHKRPMSPSNYKPKVVPRYRDRHPEDAPAETMQVDEYVIDTFIREEIPVDADGKEPEFQGNVGYIMMSDEDAQLFFEGEESDSETMTDEDDENAEGYYANDYPEDELSSDDEYDRNPYKREHYAISEDEDADLNYDSDDDEYDVDADFDDDGIPRKKLVPPKNPGFWGLAGEK
ncbi:hypothetical protein BS50DRAFT_566786 [Corynespora cassiicola Philippines]|uniref:Transcription factor Iwr1 domain-containing protein n=1 Tax=Corynespora cassiicola Philippines TaxID=1448308 RepID=A0A2T2P868_CORCC|nr:hypothetical protein BS50DRAFT_566786 [Corynespora cassiicola Philippines]